MSVIVLRILFLPYRGRGRFRLCRARQPLGAVKRLNKLFMASGGMPMPSSVTSMITVPLSRQAANWMLPDGVNDGVIEQIFQGHVNADLAIAHDWQQIRLDSLPEEQPLLDGAVHQRGNASSKPDSATHGFRTTAHLALPAWPGPAFAGSCVAGGRFRARSRPESALTFSGSRAFTFAQQTGIH